MHRSPLWKLAKNALPVALIGCVGECLKKYGITSAIGLNLAARVMCSRSLGRKQARWMEVNSRQAI